MPIPALEKLTPEMQRLLAFIEANLYVIAKDEQITREEAIAIKIMFQRPLGLLNCRFDLHTNSSDRKKHRLRRNHLTISD